ncbi:F-box only protein 48-like [Glandiceps talaboti]
METQSIERKNDYNGNEEVPTTETNTDIIQILPVEMCFNIVTKMDISTICQLSQTSKNWNDTIEHTDWLWKYLCLNHLEDNTYVEDDRAQGFTWRETFIRNYGYNVIQRHWFNGVFSNIKSFEDLPQKCMCPMDLETWGQILELELCR